MGTTTTIKGTKSSKLYFLCLYIVDMDIYGKTNESNSFSFEALYHFYKSNKIKRAKSLLVI